MKRQDKVAISNLPFIFVISSLLIFGLIACKKAPSEPGNQPPQVQLRVENLAGTTVNPLDSLIISAVIEDELPVDSLETAWRASGGTFLAEQKSRAAWLAPALPGAYWLSCRVTDPDGDIGVDSLQITVGNRPPTILAITPDSAAAVIGNQVLFRCAAIDSDGHALTFDWQVEAGQLLWARADSMLWKAPQIPRQTRIMVRVQDEFQAEARDTTLITTYREAGSVWIADTGNRDVVKVSGEGRMLFRVSGFHTPTALAVDAVRRTVWVADPGQGRVTLLNFAGQSIATLTGLGGPMDVDVYRPNGRAWVVETDSNRVAELSRDGTLVLRRIFGFLHPAAVAIDPKNGNVYVADTGNHRIVKLTAAVPDSYNVATDSTHHRIYPGLLEPVDVQVDLLQNHFWVIDRLLEKAFRMTDSSSSRQAVSGLRLPSAVAIDSHREIVWIADTGNDRILKTQNFSIIGIINGLLLPQALSIDPIDGSLWIADTENDRIVKTDVDGNRLFEIYGFSSPRAIAVNPGQ